MSYTVRPMLGEEDDPPEMLIDPEALEALEEIDGVSAAPPAMMATHLHALSMRRQSGGGLWPFGRGRS